MSNPLSALNFTAFSVGGTNMLAVLKTFGFTADNDEADAGGLADRYEVNQAVKQGQLVDFTVFLPLESGLSAGNIDISLWELGGTEYLGTVRSGGIEVITVDKEASGIGSLYKSPSATRTRIRVTTDKLVVTSAPFLESLMTGSAASFNVAAAITFGTAAFTCPVTIRSAKHTVDRDEMQMEQVVLTGAGTPTGPSDSSLLGNVLLGTSLVTLSANTGGGIYATGSGQIALIRSLETRFADGSLIEQKGVLAVQGGATWTSS